MAEHIKARNDWYRALAYVKPSGMNLFSAENRLPNRCVDGPAPDGEPPTAGQCTCNTQVWAEQGRYKPSELYDFYVDQFTLLGRLLPDKDQSYMLIQNGFPIINKFGEYPEQIPPPRDLNDLPEGDDQTQEVLRLGNVHLGERFAVQHNGLQACPATGECRDPNYMVRNKGDLGWVTGLQTTNAGSPKDAPCSDPTRVCDPDSLYSALQNGASNAPHVVFVEVYEERFWEEKMRVGARYPTASGKRTVGQWDDFFHTRRRALFPDLPNPEPTTHSHTFARTQAGTAPQSLPTPTARPVARRCRASPRTGTISIMPSFVTKSPALGDGGVGFSHLAGPPQGRGRHDAQLRPCHVGRAGRRSTASSTRRWPAGVPARCPWRSRISRVSPASTARSRGPRRGRGRPARRPSSRRAELAGPQLFVRGLRVCTGGTFPQVKGIEVSSAKVNDDGTVNDAIPTKKFTPRRLQPVAPAALLPAGRGGRGGEDLLYRARRLHRLGPAMQVGCAGSSELRRSRPPCRLAAYLYMQRHGCC